MHAVLIRDHILTAHRGFTDQLARYLDVIGVRMLPGRSKPPSIRAAEVAAAAAIVLRLAELATPRRALPAGRQVDAGATPPTSASAARMGIYRNSKTLQKRGGAGLEWLKA